MISRKINCPWLLRREWVMGNILIAVCFSSTRIHFIDFTFENLLPRIWPSMDIPVWHWEPRQQGLQFAFYPSSPRTLLEYTVSHWTLNNYIFLHMKGDAPTWIRWYVCIYLYLCFCLRYRTKTDKHSYYCSYITLTQAHEGVHMLNKIVGCWPD